MIGKCQLLNHVVGYLYHGNSFVAIYEMCKYNGYHVKIFFNEILFGTNVKVDMCVWLMNDSIECKHY